MPSEPAMTLCPTDDTLGALVERALSQPDADRVTEHLDACDVCRGAVIAAVRGRPEPDGVTTLALGTPSLPWISARGTAPPIGTRIGRYQLRRLLGAGGMGQVYEAYDADLDRAIALKLLRPELAGVPNVTERLARESRTMAKVVHPSVITVYDVGRADDVVFIAMELVRGETLASFVARTRPGWRDILGLYERAGEGLAAAHAAGIVHRDFKPDNVLVEVTADRAARVLVTDFGIACAADAVESPSPSPTVTRDLRLTATGAAIGTPAYMAPEQLAGGAVDVRADVFAFAVSLWEALFGVRPFTGTTVTELGAAMSTPLRSPGGVPRRITDALIVALAQDPAGRWRDMPAFLRALAGAPVRRRRAALAAGATGLVGLGVGAALLVSRGGEPDRCTVIAAPLAQTWNTARADGLRASLGVDPATRDAVLADLDTKAAAWRTTQAATCRTDREPAQAPTTSACLDARRLELAAYIEDTILDGPAHARTLAGILGDPTACASPAPGPLMARVPEDRALRRKVTQLRYRAFDAEAERDRGEFATALEHGASLVKEAASLWPASHAEALYLLGTTQAQGGDTRQSIATLRDAAAIAETAHQDYTAANAWIQLASGTTFDEGAPARGLEYVRYAEAANDRLGKPADVTVLIEYVKGSTLVEANRHADAEVALRHAVELAETIAPDYLPQAIQGLGYLYEDQGRYRDAVEAYRSALGKLPATGPGVASSSVIFRVRLAANLSSLGRNDEALAMGREAVTIADRTLPTDTIDRAAAHVELAQLLASSGLLPEALAEAQRAAEDIANNAGERNARYGEALAVVASILENQGRFAEADEKYARACEIVAFATAELSSQHAECLLDETGALEGMHRQKHALAVLDKILPVLEKTYPGTHPQIANAYVQRGSMHAMLGHHALALADLERAVAMFGAIEIDPGHLASARWALAQELWDRDPVRAKTLLAQARATLATAGATWARPRRDADEFAAAHAK